MYRRSLFTFIDILGFREISQKSKPEDIKSLLEIFKRNAMPNEQIASDMEMSFLTFSDCTIRIVPIESTSNQRFASGILWNELWSLVHLQAEMVRKECFIRGGLTIDDIYVDNSMVFGPAIIKAYSLESEFAVYPRIVVDPEVFALFEREPLLKRHDTEIEWEYLMQLIRRDSDGLYFVDYVSGILSEFDDEGMEFVFLGQHKAAILKNAVAHKGLNKIAAKYLWLANYHNTVVKEISPDHFAFQGLDRRDFIITPQELPLLYEYKKTT